MPDAIRARFNGPPAGERGHEFVNGVPARSLTEAEYAALTADEQRRLVEARRRDGSPMYTLRSEREMHPARFREEPAPMDSKPAAKPAAKGGD